MFKRTRNFKIEIGTRFQDEKRHIVIIDKKSIPKYNKDGSLHGNYKYYKYKCNKCGFECGKHYKNGEYKDECWIEESSLLRGTGCSCCRGFIVAEGINDIPTTTPWMVGYFQGGYDEAKLYTRSSTKKITPICSYCRKIKENKLSISTINSNHSIGCGCGDKIPYTEKFIFSVLKQLGLDFQTQLSKTTFKWCGKYKYDFYFEYNNKQYIIETHGEQHYKNSFSRIKGANSLEQEQINDELKKELALRNEIKEENYIVIDCRKSDLEWIKEHVLNSKLNQLFDLSKIDWLKAEEFSVSNLVKVACEYKRNDPNLTTTDIGKSMHLHTTSISKYLKKGNDLGWCVYNSKQELIKSVSNNGKNNAKQVEIFKNNMSLGIFSSGHEIERISEKLFGVKLIFQAISAVCLGKTQQYKGYTFTYTQ